MTKHILLVFAMSVALVTGCATTPTSDIQVDAEADPKINFSGYKSYAWLGSIGMLTDPEGKWKQPEFDVDTEIRFLIDRELRKRGYSETGNRPDMLVAYAAGVDMAALKIKKNPETKQHFLKNVPKGALIIILVDAETEFVIWMGQVTAQVQQNPDSNIVKQRLDYAITQVMQKIPK